jgi:ubiquinone/menaquinone biosynthesis C-methylase UbiE
MIAQARENAARADTGNAEFLAAHIEGVPLPDGQVDVVISNCVINMSADKAAAWRRPSGCCGRAGALASAT